MTSATRACQRVTRRGCPRQTEISDALTHLAHELWPGISFPRAVVALPFAKVGMSFEPPVFVVANEVCNPVLSY